MNRRLRYSGMGCCALAVVLMVFPDSVPAAETPRSEDGMALVRSRNIFDPNRRPGRRSDGQRDSSEPPRAELLVLTGTMLHTGRDLAFFGGSESAFRKVVTVGEQVGRFTVARIQRGEVELTGDDQRHVLGVGKSLKRLGEGPWEVSEERVTATAPSAARTEERAERSPAPATANGPAAAPEGSNDTMRRMMERRRQEESR